MIRVGLLGSRPARSMGFLAWLQSLGRIARDWIVQAFASSFAQGAVSVRESPIKVETTPTRLRQDSTHTLGTHLLVELYGCKPEAIAHVREVEQTLVDSAHASNARIVSHYFHAFEPYGVSGVVIIEESHYTIHTWPEHRYAAVDLFFCSETVDPQRAIEVLQERFQPQRLEVAVVRRGVLQQIRAGK